MSTLNTYFANLLRIICQNSTMTLEISDKMVKPEFLLPTYVMQPVFYYIVPTDWILIRRVTLLTFAKQAYLKNLNTTRDIYIRYRIHASHHILKTQKNFMGFFCVHNHIINTIQNKTFTVRIKLRILTSVRRIFESSTTWHQVCYICNTDRTGLTDIGSSVISLSTYCFK